MGCRGYFGGCRDIVVVVDKVVAGSGGISGGARCMAIAGILYAKLKTRSISNLQCLDNPYKSNSRASTLIQT